MVPILVHRDIMVESRSHRRWVRPPHPRHRGGQSVTSPRTPPESTLAYNLAGGRVVTGNQHRGPCRELISRIIKQNKTEDAISPSVVDGLQKYNQLLYAIILPRRSGHTKTSPGGHPQRKMAFVVEVVSTPSNNFTIQQCLHLHSCRRNCTRTPYGRLHDSMLDTLGRRKEFCSTHCEQG